jgi:NADPH:quinone reductase-like Zn-dependent oxidoreductase
VKVHSVAINPTDSIFIPEPVCEPGRVIGSDFAGTVAKLGSGVTRWSIGDRVAGFLQGGKPLQHSDT